MSKISEALDAAVTRRIGEGAEVRAEVMRRALRKGESQYYAEILAEPDLERRASLAEELSGGCLRHAIRDEVLYGLGSRHVATSLAAREFVRLMLAAADILDVIALQTHVCPASSQAKCWCVNEVKALADGSGHDFHAGQEEATEGGGEDEEV